MSNRLLGILIIIGFLGVGYLYYNLIYIPEQKTEIRQEQELKQKIIEQKKEIKLMRQESNTVNLTNAQKIENIKQKSKNYKTFNLNNSSLVFFKESNNSLDLFINDTKIGNFQLVYPEYLEVSLIKGTNNALYIEVGPDKFYYNNKTKNISEIELNINVQYVKKGTNNRLIFITDKGSFLYYIYKNEFEYFSLFNDFVYLNDGYIGVINKNDKRVLNNFGFTSEGNNLIVYYNSDTKEKKIIFKTDLDIEQIYVENDKFYIQNVDGDVFELENIKQ